MGKPLNEQKVLEKLNIDDFRHLTKDKIITMASMLDEMDPEVAKKALEQFPQFSNEVKEILTEYKDTLDKNLESNRESVQSYYDSCKTIIKTLEKQLDKENLSFEERKYIIEKMSEILDNMGEKDSENKKFFVAIAGGCATAACVVVGIFASVLGGNTKINIKDFNKFK